ncbi:glycerol-3-phosphate 1-O-acyltransferase PlsY [Aquimonas voraii]|uniref:Glycerol-3-phosphate acyltransferase n=1 Tax=Aquimonas voraii TaxID=265719 RepID=A0A1G6XYH5_9GAMM|nr:glycerol-3-phosphate 1-O-acyltransferase PlsY [Aquimonas voraii]SDD83228.1 glycerol-3-phosphate acyltransferase PlsY [Aquimonas voraii]
MLQSLIALLLAYLLGSLSGSLLIGRAIGVDIRQSGSGNAGGTNAFRTRGWRFALGVVLIDIGKGALAAALGAWLWTPEALLSATDLAGACTLAAAIGHTWPVFFGFRGGKGAGTLVGGLCVVWPLSVGPVFLVWMLCLVLTGYVGLSTILGAAVLVPLALWIAPAQLGFAVAAASFILFTHRSNVQRLLRGTEHRFERVRLFHRRAG